jgi:heat shock protein HslJ
VIRALALSLLLAGCATASAPGYMQGDWRLVRLDGQPTTDVVTVQFNPDGTYGGQSFCNHFGGKYEVRRGRLFAGGMITTAACADPIRMEREHTLMDSVIWLKPQVRVDGDRLVLSAEHSAEFARGPE